MANTISKQMFQLDGRVAVVTGAGSGLGRVFARTLALYGAAVICADVTAAGNEETAAMIAGEGGKARTFILDVADAAAVAGLAADIQAREKKVDVLVNNAGISTGKDLLHELPVAKWDRVMAVNLRGVFLCMHCLLPLMLPQQRGSVINISSIAGLVGVDPRIPSVSSNYAAAKAGVIGLTRAAAAEYGGHGIRVNAIAPGWHLGTNLSQQRHIKSDPEKLKAYVDRLRRDTPLARTGEPEELAGLVIYLASDASSFVTGQVIAHDGGWSAW